MKTELHPMMHYVKRGSWTGAKWTAIVSSVLFVIAWLVLVFAVVRLALLHEVPIATASSYVVGNTQDILRDLATTVGIIAFLTVLGAVFGSMFGFLGGLRSRRLDREQYAEAAEQ